MLNHCFDKLRVVISFAVLLVGCVSQGDLPDNYQLTNSGTDGITAFSIQCSSQDSNGLTVATLSFDGDSLLSFIKDKQEINLSCDGFKSIKFLDLPAGQYEFNNFSQNSFGSYYTKDFDRIKFFVIPNKVNYIGSLAINVVGDKVSFYIKDEQKADIPVILRRLPNISSNNYAINIMHF